MSSPKNCSIVIVHWNSFELLCKQLEQLSDCSDDIIVIDNNSDDFVAEKLTQYSIRIVRNPYNRGFGAACNQGALLARHSWLLFLNPDVEITREALLDWLKKNHELGLAASSPISGAEYAKPVPTPASLFLEFTPLGRFMPQLQSEAQTLIGGLLLIDVQVFRSIGGYDERFFMWFEDSDLTRRLNSGQVKIGRVSVVVKHLGGGSIQQLGSRKQKQFFFLSMRVYAQKHFGFFGQLITSLLSYRFDRSFILPLSNPKLISIVVPNVQKNLLDRFLQQLAVEPVQEPIDIEYIVVTSALSMARLWEYRRQWPLIRWIILEKPIGFAATVNIGLRAASAGVYGTVNDDVIFDQDMYGKLRAALTKKTGSINPVVVDGDGCVESAGIAIEPRGKALPLWAGTKYAVYQKENTQEKTAVPATNAACVLYNRSALDTVGLFDERFGSYLEDIDLSLRMSRAGFVHAIVPTLSVLHLQHQTTRSFGRYKRYLDCKNWFLVVVKNWSLSMIFFNFPAIVLERLRNIWGIIK